MSYDRSTGTLRGPCVITMGETTLRTKGDVKIGLGLETFNIESSEVPILDERISGAPISIEFDPVGEVSQEILDLLFAPLGMAVGQSLFGDTDTACTITPVAGGDGITFHCTAVTKMPNVIISATKTAFSGTTITAILANAKEWSDAAARLTVSSMEKPILAAIDPEAIPTSPARIRWGAANPWSQIASREGVTIVFDMSTEDDVTDEDGLVDMVLGGITARANFNPMGATLAQAIAKLGIQGAGVLRGASLAGRAMPLEVESASDFGIKVDIPSAALKTLPVNFSRTLPRFDDLELVSLPTSGTVAAVTLKD